MSSPMGQRYPSLWPHLFHRSRRKVAPIWQAAASISSMNDALNQAAIQGRNTSPTEYVQSIRMAFEVTESKDLPEIGPIASSAQLSG